MTVLQATVEIVKAPFAESRNGFQVLVNPDERAKLLEGIAALHEKLRELESAGVKYHD
jgi:hypothetical protein